MRLKLTVRALYIAARSLRGAALRGSQRKRYPLDNRRAIDA
jgi:hypothetical protein